MTGLETLGFEMDRINVITWWSWNKVLYSKLIFIQSQSCYLVKVINILELFVKTHAEEAFDWLWSNITYCIMDKSWNVWLHNVHVPPSGHLIIRIFLKCGYL